MTKKNKTILMNRLKSFAWRSGSLIGVGLLAFLGENLALFELGAMEVIVAGVLTLISGEVTKYLNT